MIINEFPKVSIIVPVYNVSKYLAQCLDSIIGQTLKDIEIICVNDGSTDSSLEILKKYASQDKRIIIIDKENAGYGHTMNIGMKKARGAYIGILESDDFTDCNMFEQLYNVAVLFDADIVKSNYWEYRNGCKTLAKPLKDGPYNVVFTPRIDKIDAFYNQPAIWTALYKREFLEHNHILFNETPGASYQDTSFNFMVLACAERMVLEEEAYVCYRIDNESSSVNSAGKVYCVLDEYEYSNDFLKSRKEIGETLKGLLPALLWNTSQWNFNRIAFQFKYGFLERLIGIYDDLWNKGTIYPQYWVNKSYLKDVVRILLDKNYFLHELYCLFQKIEFLYNVLECEMKHCKKVYLYGAGIIGQEVASYLNDKNLNFESFVVGDVNDNPERVMEKAVVSINELSNNDISNALVLLTVNESIQRDVLPALRERGFNRIFAIRREMREYMAFLPKYDIHQLVYYIFDKEKFN